MKILILLCFFGTKIYPNFVAKSSFIAIKHILFFWCLCRMSFWRDSTLRVLTMKFWSGIPFKLRPQYPVLVKEILKFLEFVGLANCYVMPI